MNDLPTHPESLLSIDQVARLLGVDTRTVRRWRRTDKIPPAISVNGQLRWRLQAISEWVRRLEIENEIKRRKESEAKAEGSAKKKGDPLV